MRPQTTQIKYQQSILLKMGIVEHIALEMSNVCQLENTYLDMPANKIENFPVFYIEK